MNIHGITSLLLSFSSPPYLFPFLFFFSLLFVPPSPFPATSSSIVQVVGARVRNTVQRAYLEGVDVEQLLSEKDPRGTHFISASAFKDFLRQLSTYGTITSQDMAVCVRKFSKRKEKPDDPQDPVSLSLFMGFVGKQYVGNLHARLKAVVKASGHATQAGVTAIFQVGGVGWLNLLYFPCHRYTSYCAGHCFCCRCCYCCCCYCCC